MESPNLIALLRLIVRWRKALLAVVVAALILSIVISDPHIMPPKYKSTSVFLASSPNMTSTQSLFVDNKADYFGTGDDVDRLLAIANGAPLKQYLVAKYHLFNHYKIDSATTRYPNYKVMKELDENYSAIKNDKGAVEITVYDTDKQLAADMCNDIVHKTDDMNNSIILDNREKVYTIYTRKLQEKQEQLRLLSDSIVMLKDATASVNSLSDLHRAATATGDAAHNLANAEERLAMLEERKKSGLKDLTSTLTLAEEYKATMNKDVPSIFILERAYPAEKKSKPVRWLIVLGSVLGAFVLSVLAVALMERIRAMRWQEVLQDA